ncbi:hypothetical protein PLESTM_001864700 [Pleodorina starrii]|nr:hypothetical protein PLESTM_001864700 [Pleodorina starrii]
MADCATSGEISNHGADPSGPEVPPNVFAAFNTMFEWAHKFGRPLERRDLNALRRTCRGGRDLVDQHDPELNLRFWAPIRGLLDGWLQKLLGGWAARLERRQRCTCLRVEICFETRLENEDQRRWRTTCMLGRLLALFDAAPGTAENIRELHIRLSTGTGHVAVDLSTTLPERLAARFPSLQDLGLMGTCVPADPQSFYSGIALHLPRLQRLQVCFLEGLNYLELLTDRLTQLRDLTLGNSRYSNVSVSPEEAKVLARFPNLRTLRLQQWQSCGRPSQVHVLRFGLGEALEELEIEGGGVRLTRVRMSEDCSSSGQPRQQQQQQQIRSWDMVATERYSLESVIAAVTEAELPLTQLRVQKAELGLILSDSLLRYLDVLKVDALRLKFDREVPQLGRALQRLTKPPKYLSVLQVQHRANMARLLYTCAPLLAPRLQRLEFHWCAGLTPANLVSLLVALPLCEEVVVRSCERVHTGRQYMALVEGLLALPPEEELRSRPLHIHLEHQPLRHHRPLESVDSTEYVDAEAGDEGDEVDNASLLSWTYSQGTPSFEGISEDDKECYCQLAGRLLRSCSFSIGVSRLASVAD